MAKNMYNNKHKYKFEWDENKNRENIAKHGLSFEKAQKAFLDRQCYVISDCAHSNGEKRYACVGDTGEGIATVRITMRGNRTRIFGAGYWRRGRRNYEKRYRG